MDDVSQVAVPLSRSGALGDLAAATATSAPSSPTAAPFFLDDQARVLMRLFVVGSSLPATILALLFVASCLRNRTPRDKRRLAEKGGITPEGMAVAIPLFIGLVNVLTQNAWLTDAVFRGNYWVKMAAVGAVVGFALGNYVVHYNPAISCHLFGAKRGSHASRMAALASPIAGALFWVVVIGALSTLTGTRA